MVGSTPSIGVFVSMILHMQGVFAHAMGALGGGQQQQQAAAAEAPQLTAAAVQSGGEGGFDSGSGGGVAVKNLGVVGRGTKRINLQPVQVWGAVGGEVLWWGAMACCCGCAHINGSHCTGVFADDCGL